jgi:hypothetical protein
MWGILQAHIGADVESLVDPFQNALAGHLEGSHDLAYSLAGMITRQDLRALDIAEGGDLGLAKLIEAAFLLIGKNELRTCGCSCHWSSIAPNKIIWICFSKTLY